MLKIGHRGAAGTKPENSSAAFKEALKYKVDMIEIDVRLTKDDKVVIFHDSDLKRLCNEEYKISELTLRELKKYDIGSSFSLEYYDERILTLQDAINMVGIKAGLNIEVKIDGNKRDIIAVKIGDLLVGEGIAKRCTITSFDYKFLRIFKDLYPDIKTGVIFEQNNPKWIEILEETEANGISINYKILNEKYIKEAKAEGYFIYVWTVNDQYEIKRIKKLKVDGIISDYPALL